MKFDASLLSSDLADMAAYGAAVESIGFDGLWMAETNGDPFARLLLAAEHSQRILLGTAIAVAFPRSPTVIAHTAWDLARFSQGRFVLGLGSQVRGHIERRFGVAWGKPVSKLREMILAIRALWGCWQEGTALDFKGEFFHLNLMTPFFNPGPHDFPGIPIFVSAVNRGMLQMAGEVCDGVHLHALHTVKYLREFALPNLGVGLEKSGRSRSDLTLNTAVFVIPLDDPATAFEAERFVRQQLSFYLSTPAYKVVSDLHGWGDISARLSRLARRGQWDEMPGLINDDIMESCTISGRWAELPDRITSRYGSMIDRIAYYLPFVPGEKDDGWRQTIAGFKRARANTSS